jgi:glycosyltransferase involved in cell wall biosynthesis
MNNKQIKVLHVLNELKPSGAESMLLAAQQEFSTHNIVGEILSTGDQIGPYAVQLREAGYVIHHLPYRKSPFFFLSVFRLMREGYGAIHLHTQRGNFWFGLIARMAVAGPVIRTIHSSFTFDGLVRIRTRWSRRMLQFCGVRHVAISESVRRVESSLYGISPLVVSNWYDSAHFIPPTADEKKAARTKFDIPDDAFVIASVGNCATVKNHSAIIRALALLPKNQRLLYLHLGQEDATCSEQNLASQLKLESNILFLGATRDVRPALYAADIFVMPSLLEGFGIAAVEALGCGLPAIFTKVDGLRDFASYYPNLVFCGTAAEEIAESLQQLISMRTENRMRLVQDHARISQENFGILKGVNGYVALYINRATD